VKNVGKPFKVASVFVALVFLALISTPSKQTQQMVAEPAEAALLPQSGQSAAASSLPADVQITTDELAKLLQASGGVKPLLIHVGFYTLYAQAHIAGSEYIGPASQQEALEKLRRRVERLPRKKFIVLYCGCCPWSHCPTARPAYDALHNMGFTRVKVLFIPNNFGDDWIAKGYPVEKGQ
jgi:rhodanese-related sulfurtransferase